MTKPFKIQAIDYRTLQLTVAGACVTLTIKNPLEFDDDGEMFTTLADQVVCIRALLASRGVTVGDKAIRAMIHAEKKAAADTSISSVTDAEKQVLVSILHAGYDVIFVWAHKQSRKPHDIPDDSVGAVLNSLLEKGLIDTDLHDGTERCMRLTESGRAAALAADTVDGGNSVSQGEPA